MLPDVVWDALMFFEDATKRPPLLLRWCLPTPLSTHGSKFEVGNTVHCRYTGGYLCKRITNIVDSCTYAFEVTEQRLALGGITLLSGDYTFSKLAAGRTRVALTTRYTSPNQPRWLCRWIERIVCHSFHRHILSAMQDKLG